MKNLDEGVRIPNASLGSANAVILFVTVRIVKLSIKNDRHGNKDSAVMRRTSLSLLLQLSYLCLLFNFR